MFGKSKAMKTLVPCLILLFAHNIFAQPAVPVAEDKDLNLQQRFYQMKANAETYSDYKVIKEFQLDRIWRIIHDSLKENRASIRKANDEIGQLKTEMVVKENDWASKVSAYNDLEFAGTHISFLGISFGKKTFIYIFLFVVGGLLFLTGIAFIRLKGMAGVQKERSDLMNSLTAEFEEYKRKALDRQMKLSRELQNERNRLSEMRKT